MIILSIFVALVMGAVSLLHFYWAFGGSFGLRSAGPTLENGTVFEPGRGLTFLVACLMLGLAALPIRLLIPSEPVWGFPLFSYTGYLVAAIFVIRGIGDFKYVGLFKKVYNSKFASLDTRYFSPLIICLGITYGTLATLGTN